MTLKTIDFNKLLNKLQKAGLKTNIGERWEKGIRHHAKSVELMKFLEEFDFNECGDFFGWKVGGDGDNGEHLMFQMDVYFDAKDKNLI